MLVCMFDKVTGKKKLCDSQFFVQSGVIIQFRFFLLDKYGHFR